MAVKITKPEINVREKLSELDKPSGIAGEAMLRAETPQEQQALIGVGRRNILLNGDLQVSQRGDYTTAGTAPNAYVLDRWLVDRNGTATVQHTTGHDLPGSPTICKAVKLVQTVTGTNYLGVRQQIENPSIYAARTFTYSAWIRSNTPNARIECYIPGTSPNIYIGPNHSGNGEWEYLSYTFTLNPGTPTAFHADVFIDNGSYSNTTIIAGDYIEATMMQLEVGIVATPFEHRSYGEELVLCQRYFERIDYTTSKDTGGGAAAETLVTNGLQYQSNRTLSYLPFLVIKRTQPTVTISSASHLQILDSSNGWIAASSFNGRATTRGTRLDCSHSGNNLTAGRACEVRLVSPGYIEINAEI
jgi:hypothetical protein